MAGPRNMVRTPVIKSPTIPPQISSARLAATCLAETTRYAGSQHCMAAHAVDILIAGPLLCPFQTAVDRDAHVNAFFQ